MGTPTLKPYKREIKSYQNDTILKEKATKNKTCNELEKDVVQFPSGLGGNDIIEKIFKEPIHQQLRVALQYIKNVIIIEKVVKHPDRAEADRFFNFSYAAVEEALSNAVYHRAYDEREPIEVRVENDRIEIVSFPGPDRFVTIEGLKSYRVSNRRYRNRRIGDFLKELQEEGVLVREDTNRTGRWVVKEYEE